MASSRMAMLNSTHPNCNCWHHLVLRLLSEAFGVSEVIVGSIDFPFGKKMLLLDVVIVVPRTNTLCSIL